MRVNERVGKRVVYVPNGKSALTERVDNSHRELRCRARTVFKKPCTEISFMDGG